MVFSLKCCLTAILRELSIWLRSSQISIMTKIKFSVFDKYLQRHLFCFAYTVKQARIMLIKQALAINGKYQFWEIKQC